MKVNIKVIIKQEKDLNNILQTFEFNCLETAEKSIDTLISSGAVKPISITQEVILTTKAKAVRRVDPHGDN